MKIVANKIIIVMLMVSTTVLAQDRPQTYDWDVLLNGEVKVESIKNSLGIPGVRVLFVVSATRQKIWRALLDYDNFSNIFAGIDKLQVLEENQKGALVEFWVDAVIKKLHYILFRKYSQEGVLIEWNRVSGDLKMIQGSWRIEQTAMPNKKLLIYESYVDIGYSVVTWAIRQGAKMKAKKMAYRLRDWLEKPSGVNISD